VKEKRTSGNFFSEDSSFSQITGKTGTESLEMLLMARESLKVVRKEARIVFHSSRKAIKDSQKSRRSSLPEGDLKGVLSFCCNEENPIRDLAENINAIKNRVLLNEVNNQKQIKEQIWLKETLRRMEKRMERREREKKNDCHGCVGFCTVI
jgi:predicted nucleotidyltransferase